MPLSLECINAEQRLADLAVAVALPSNTVHGREQEHSIGALEDRDWVLGMVSHELRNSIAAITLLSKQLMRGPAASATAQTAASRILVSAGRMNRIIRDLLDVSKARLGGGIEITPSPVNAHEICERTVDELEAANPGREIRLLLHGNADGCWDGIRLEQVVCNLVSNALQYGAADSPISIESHGGGTHWTLSVHNLGSPIPPATLARLYDPFERGCGNDTWQGGAPHLGIGLFIVRQLVLGHHGTIDATSSTTEGTRFVVRLPHAVTGVVASGHAAPRGSLPIGPSS